MTVMSELDHYTERGHRVNLISPYPYHYYSGMRAWEGLQASGPQKLNMDLVRGDESPAEMVRLSYSLESGLQNPLLSFAFSAIHIWMIAFSSASFQV